MLAGTIVSPNRKEVIPVCPELIRRQDGAKRFYADLRREHPHLKIIATEDGLSANAPHIKYLMAHDIRYILAAKPGDHTFLFNLAEEAARRGEVTEPVLADAKDENKLHCFRFINSAPLNQTSQDELQVNFIEHWEVVTKGDEVTMTT